MQLYTLAIYIATDLPVARKAGGGLAGAVTVIKRHPFKRLVQYCRFHFASNMQIFTETAVCSANMTLTQSEIDSSYDRVNGQKRATPSYLSKLEVLPSK